MDATEYLLLTPANRVRLLRSMDQVDTERIIARGFYRREPVDDPHRIFYDGEGDWLLETESHVGDD